MTEPIRGCEWALSEPPQAAGRALVHLKSMCTHTCKKLTRVQGTVPPTPLHQAPPAARPPPRAAQITRPTEEPEACPW